MSVHTPLNARNTLFLLGAGHEKQGRAWSKQGPRELLPTVQTEAGSFSGFSCRSGNECKI